MPNGLSKPWKGPAERPVLAQGPNLLYCGPMDQLVLYVSELLRETDTMQLSGTSLQTVYYKRDFIEALVDQPGLIGAAVLMKESDEEWEALVESVSRSFPLLPILLLTQVESVPRETDAATLVRSKISQSGVELELLLSRLTSGGGSHDRREYHRYDFPLRARLHADDEPVHQIRHLSAGGAFLNPVGPAPQSGTICEIELMFQNFSINTTCEVLDPRQASSNAEPGFGIRFTALSPAATSFINRTVQDALVQVLTNPDADPALPTLDEDEDLLSIGDEFTLAI